MQLGLFDSEKEEFHLLDKKVRLITLFSGYDSQALALKYLGVPFEHYKTCEWGIPSILALYDLHFNDPQHQQETLLDFDTLCSFYAQMLSNDWSNPMTLEQVKKLGEKKLKDIDFAVRNSNNLVNICKVNGADLEIVDKDKYNYIMTYSFPCFTANNLVLTREGYKHINEVKVGDYVLTHTNSYQRVLHIYDNGSKKVLGLKAMGVDKIELTPNHKLYVREMYRKNNQRKFSDPMWLETANLTNKHYYVGIAINQCSIIPSWNGIDCMWADGRKTRHYNRLNKLMSNPNWWYVVGRYFADGWQRTGGGIIICSNPNKLKELTNALDSISIHYVMAKERTTIKVHIAQKEIGEFFKQFGNRAVNKHLTSTILDLPTTLLESFLNGYWYADGYTKGKWNKATTTSRLLAYGLGECIAKVYHRPYSITYCCRPKTAVIEGRTIHQNDTYEVRFKKQADKQDKAFYENDYIWSPITNIYEIGEQEVYDLEVEKDHSFTIQNAIVHNCQDLSLSGNKNGMVEGSGTRSSLLWEVGRILDELAEQDALPQMLLMENVPQVLEKQNVKEFAKWISKLEGLGYCNYEQVLNAKDFGIPQNRARCYMVSLLGQYNYYFPKPPKTPVALLDVLEEEVDEKYYLSKKALYGALHTNYWKATLGQRLPRDEDGTTHTLQARDYKDAHLVMFDKETGKYYDPQKDEDGLIAYWGNCHEKGWKERDKNELIELTSGQSQGNRVYDPKGISSCLTSNGGGQGAKTGLYLVDDTKQEFKVIGSKGITTTTRKVDKNGLIEFGKNYYTIPNNKGNINTQCNRFYKVESLCPVLGTDNTPKVIITSDNKRLLDTAEKLDLNNENPQFLDCYNKKVSTTTTTTITTRVDASNEDFIYHKYRIRKLTPKECFRLMGVKDEDYNKIAPRQNDRTLYHMVGDSIVVDVLMAIFKEVL